MIDRYGGIWKKMDASGIYEATGVDVDAIQLEVGLLLPITHLSIGQVGMHALELTRRCSLHFVSSCWHSCGDSS